MMENNIENLGRELKISRLLNAPVELVWEVWTNPEHLKNWWGPDGFSNTISQMDLRKDGIWELVMHGPDGVDYQNKSVFVEVDKYRKIVYQHLTSPKFLSTIVFEAQGHATLIHWHMLFESEEQFVQVLKTFKADEGLRQNIDKLAQYVSLALQSELKIIKRLKAPKALVFEAFSTREAMASWWGPVGMQLKVNQFDFRPQGKFHYCMEGGGQMMWGLFVFQKIQPTDVIEFISSFSDAEGNVCNSPFPMDFPLEIYNQITLVSEGEETILTLQGFPYQATEAQMQTYQSIESSMQDGFGATFNQLERYLEARMRLRVENKMAKGPRVTTYLNFNGNTEEAMLFYKGVFGTEFLGKGMQRFGEIPAGEGMPVLPDAVKGMILHVELPTLGGHVMMATDAPDIMGFTLNTGNNMHINLEPETREEATRLFLALSEGGIVTMPQEDMFFGAYYGSCTDKFGINWMVTHYAAK